MLDVLIRFLLPPVFRYQFGMERCKSAFPYVTDSFRTAEFVVYFWAAEAIDRAKLCIEKY